MTAPRCSACARTLTGDLLLPREGQVMVIAGGGIPFLYNGVVCKGCGRVECTDCQKQRGQMGDTPCRWCGDRVMPAFDNNVAMYHSKATTPFAAAAPSERHPWPRWSDLFCAPLRLIVLLFFLWVVVFTVGMATFGVYALLVKESYGPLAGEDDSVYWIASTFGQHVRPYIAYACWAVGLVTLFILTLGMDGFWRMMNAMMMTKPDDPSLNPSRLEVGFHRLLTAAGCIALVTLPILVSFTEGADRPPTVVCTLSKEGLYLRGAEVIPGEMPKPSTSGGSGDSAKTTTSQAAAPGAPEVPPKPMPVQPEQLHEGKLGEKVERTVAWKDVTSVWFTGFKGGETILHWTNAAGREDWLALPAHVQFTTDGVSPAGWSDAVERFAPHVLLLDRDPHQTRLLWPVLDAATVRRELEGRLKPWNFRGVTVRGKVRQVKLELESWHKAEEWRKVNVVLGGDADAVRCTFGAGYIPEGDRKKENARLDRAATLPKGQEVVIRGTVFIRDRDPIGLTDCQLLDAPGEGNP
ncbi:MAG: hypothetical protein U0736_03570 [Gemmataceae bacterium]